MKSGQFIRLTYEYLAPPEDRNNVISNKTVSPFNEIKGTFAFTDGGTSRIQEADSVYIDKCPVFGNPR